MKRLSIVLISLMLLFSCGMQPISGNGKMAKKMIPLSGNYNAISVHGSFDVKVVQSNQMEAEIQADENLLELIEVVEVDNVLHIQTKKGTNGFSTKNPLLVVAPLNNASSFSVSGSGNLFCNEPISDSQVNLAVSGSGDLEIFKLIVDEVNMAVSGSGDLKAEGEAKKTNIKVSGSGDIHAKNLRANIVNAVVSGSGTAKVHALKILDAAVSGSGDIFYTGNAKVNKTISGSGDVMRRD